MPAWPLSQRSETSKVPAQSRRRDLTARIAWTLEEGRERGENKEGILTVGENNGAVEPVNWVALEEDLQAEANSINLAEIIGTGAESGAEVEAMTRGIVGEENHDTGPRRAGVRRRRTISVTDNCLGVTDWTSAW